MTYCLQGTTSLYKRCTLIKFTQILTDWQLIGVVLAISGIVTCLLLLGEAIPYLRDSVVKEQDTEKPHGTNVCNLIRSRPRAQL